MKKTKSSNTNRTKKNSKVSVYSKKDFSSGDGMLTTVWGPSIWHFLHTMSFNYPVNPTEDDKKHYSEFIRSLQYVLPCRHCRENLTNNFKAYPLEKCHMANRGTFSRYIYGLHETVNKMLQKKSGLKYCDVRERYEHFRSRCIAEKPKIWDFSKANTRKKKEKGCTEPLYGKKAKCVIKIVPQETKCSSFEMDKRCEKTRGSSQEL